MNNNRLLKLALLWLVAVSLTLLYLFYDATEQISTLESQIEQRDSLIQKLSHSNDLIKDYNTLSQRNAGDWKKIVEKYNTLVHEYNKLGSRLSATEDSLWVKNLLLKNSEKYYKIQYNYSYKGNQVFTNISSPKLDSALMLLDVYRDKLKYNPKKKQWVIKR